MKQFAAELQARLNVDTAFTIPLFGGIPIAESTVITWVVMAILVGLAIFLTHGMSVRHPGKRQLIAETIVTWLDNFIGGMLGDNAKEYTTWLETILLYIGLANIIGLLGMKPPTKDLDVTVALAVTSLILIEVSGIRRRKVSGWLHSFTEPIAIVTPINILEIVIRPLSLCMRLFGNVLGSFVIMELIDMLVPVVVPLVFSAYFDIFDGFIQAYVFVFLTALYVAEAVEIPEGSAEKKQKSRKSKQIVAAAQKAGVSAH